MAFYTYLWLRENGIPYYVGKGVGIRAFEQRGHRVKRPKDDAYILIQPHASEQAAYDAEKFLISYYGRMDLGTGCLANLTNGGEGFVGAKHSESTKEKMRKAKLGKKRKPFSAEHRKNLSEAHKKK